MQAVVLSADPRYGELSSRAARRLTELLDCGFFTHPTLQQGDGRPPSWRLLAHEAWWADYSQITAAEYGAQDADKKSDRYARGYNARAMLDEILTDVLGWDDTLQEEQVDREVLDLFGITPAGTTDEERALQPDFGLALAPYGFSLDED